MSFQNNQHFSHPHVLQHLILDENKEISCNACEEYIRTTEPFHGCPSCNFHLHSQCFNAPIHIQHPSHTSHPLTLLPNPTNSSSRSYYCDACGFHGNGSCYNCSPCDYDIHLRCANLPISLLIGEHQHALKLFMTPLDTDVNRGLRCDICNIMKDNKLWSYYCRECDFGTHVECAMKFKEATNSSGSMTAIERIKAAAREKEELDAAILEQRIDARCRNAMLDLHGARRRRRYYYSDSSDDDY